MRRIARVSPWVAISAALLGAGICFGEVGQAQCEAPELIAPTERVISETRPRIVWSVVNGAESYTLRVLSRVPEGRVVASHDVSVAGTSFLPPGALADERAKVTVTLRSRCGTALSTTRTAWFLVDATRTCAAPADVTVSEQGGRVQALWQAVPGAAHYEVRVHAPADGRVLTTLEAREPRATLDGSFPPAGVLSVRPRCGNVYGDMAYRVLTP